ncbi:putative geranylgeranyl pyrophosphate synthetase protein [Phaeoacremonium minimum UCRPA7]|uniref:Putative geranylgeranyl pyrophosphate synthetase protein n=1 Tax=Phaeoacremonium minimum (strain UCR-PA7) TaxID=1286976 RepID=R8BPS6_PHAM7|nr:putative geranylgeranyl pyrophosphate synthetase protein [Phaeoacremonium minimum UCRPA7]EOO01310.1 putative geranylgeranyl pyrophosphate synthetase protein [Phaeoacremonium minimum UCRPA7]
MVSELVAEISRSELTASSGLDATITSVQHVASYNWLDKNEPTISVPGSPPLWSPPSVAMKLTPDSGLVYIDQNAARNPSSPLEPLFRALCTQDTNFDIGVVDLVTDRNNIRKLLRFVRGSSNDAFEIRVEIAGDKTALFTRVEPKTKEIIQGFKVYGHRFEDAYTKRSSGSTGHHRVVGYRFGGMMCLVRHETDGYVDDKAGPAAAVEQPDTTDYLSDVLGALSIATKEKNTGGTPSLTVVNTGEEVVDLSSTLEIKTRAASKTLDLSEVSPQLWISQTPTLVVGYHRNGVFNDVRVRNMKQEIRTWEATNQTSLVKLAFLIKRIISVVEGCGNRNAIVTYDGGTKLRIVRGEQKRALPDDLYSIWESQDQKEAKLSPAQDKNRVNEPTGVQHHPKKSAALIRAQTNMPFSDVIDYAMQNGFRHIFRRMPARLADYHTLCDTLKLRGIDVLAGRGIPGIMNELRQGKSDWDPDERREISGLKSLARDSAFGLVFIFILGEPQSELQDKNKAYNATMFVVSHPRMFRDRTRKIVREAFEERFGVSYKQRQALDKWPIRDENVLVEEEATTEEERFDFDSDWSYSS